MWNSLTKRLALAWFPAACLDCGGSLPVGARLGICLGCRAGLEGWGGLTTCHGCSLPMPEIAGGSEGSRPAACGSCRIAPPEWEAVRALRPYSGRTRQVLLRGKIGKDRRMLAEIGGELASAIRIWRLGADCDCVVPVPSHPWPTLRRGFSPAAEIAAPVARSLSVPLRRWVLRTSLTGPVGVKSRSARQRRQAGQGRILCRRRLAGSRVLLIDDVMTTGSTLALCTRALLDSGAGSVEAAVWARSL